MGILTGLFEKRQHPGSSTGWEAIFGGGWSTASGVDVTPDGSLNSAVVYACVRVLAESIASLPLLVYERLERGKERAVDHPLYALLHTQPNPEMTSYELREYLAKSALTWGNAFCEIEATNGGRVRALWPLRPDRMSLERRNGRLIYTYQLDGQPVLLSADRVFHVRGMGSGLWGESPIRQQMNSVGLDMAMEEYGARFFGNGARPGGVLKHPGRLSDGAYSNLKKSWDTEHEGLSNAHRLRILEEGMEYQQITIPPEEAQFLESRKFQRSVIAGWFRVPPHMIGDLERATFSNIEHQSIEFVMHTLRPWLVRMEQAMGRALLTENERQSYVIEHLVDGLLRGDTAARYGAYAIAIQNGWMSRNEVREFENLNPFKGGDEFLVPLNMAAEGEDAPAEDMPEEAPEDVQDERHEHGRREIRADEPQAALRIERQALAASYVTLFEDALGRLVRREVADLRRGLDKHLIRGSLTAFAEWLQQFYADLRTVAPDYPAATLKALAQQAAASAARELGEDVDVSALNEFMGEYLETFAGGYVASHERQIRALMDEAVNEGQEPAPLIEGRLDAWEEREAGKLAMNEAVEAMNALVIAAYGVVGVQALRWLSTGDSCPFCDGLNGKIVGIDGYFVAAGETLGSGEQLMTVSRNKRHAPLHEGCDCIVAAVRL